MIILEHNVETGEVIERKATAEEIAQKSIDETEAAIRLSETESKPTQRQAILDRLGLTSEEARLLLS